MSEYKVVFHINELNKWKTVLSNVSNLLTDLSEDIVEVVVLANGESVRYYESGSTDVTVNSSQLMELSEKGVHFIACNNSLNYTHLSKDTLLSFIEVVPAGVSELIKKQSEGYAYIKP